MRFILNPINQYCDDLVHSSVSHNQVMKSLHRTFIALRLVFGFVAIVIFPFFAMNNASLSLIDTLTFAWFVLPLIAVVFLSNTGDFDKAQLISNLLTIPILGLGMCLSGGILASPLALWFIVPLLEAASTRRSKAIINNLSLIFLAVLAAEINSLTGYLEAVTVSKGYVFVSSLLAVIHVASLLLAYQAMIELGDNEKSATDEKYNLLASHMTDAILRHKSSGEVIFASKAIEALTATPTHMLIGTSLSAIIHPEDVGSYEKALKEASDTNSPTTAIFRVGSSPIFSQMNLTSRVNWLEKAWNSPESKLACLWIEMRCQPIKSKSNVNEIEVVCVWRDISARKAQEEQVAMVQRETARVQSMKSRFLANITHELRTPLNAVLGFSHMLKMEEEMNLNKVKREEYAGLIHEAGEHLLGIVNSILDMSKLESGKFDFSPHELDIAEVVEQCTNIVRLKAEQNKISIHKNFAENLPEILADKRALKQILLNLLSNAIKFTPNGGSITTQIRYDENTLSISVADTGIGIAAEDLPFIGEAFFQARSTYDRQYEGTGLGLSVVKGLIELHDGELKISSTKDEGTIITVILPLFSQQELRKAA